MKHIDLRNNLPQLIKLCGDVERLISKIPVKKINPREVLHLARGLANTEKIKKLCLECGEEYLVRLADSLNPCHYIRDKIIREIADNPPALAIKGGLISEGVHSELDELRRIASGGKDYLVELQQKEASFTGVSYSKIGFNN